MSEQEKIIEAFEAWWFVYGTEAQTTKYRIARLAWVAACRECAKAAWEAETHHNAVEEINKIAGTPVFEP